MNRLPDWPSGIERPLRYALPNCYRLLMDQFAAQHLHPYDVMAGVIHDDAGGYRIVLRYGEEMSYTKERYFTSRMIEQGEEAIVEFFSEAGRDCKKALMTEYYRMMKT